MYVLFVISLLIGRSLERPVVTMQEFNSSASCEFAANVIQKRYDTVTAFCVPK